ncbi:FIG00553847: hypothetical protein [Cronobacter malonaticus 681]|nr:FIG00553847: hypothetical protein [Cronobacter malonaticus 681]
MLSQLNLRFPKKLIESLKSRASAEATSVNALAGRFIEEKLMSAAPGDDSLALNADPAGTRESLYRKIVRGEFFGRQTLRHAELRWLFDHAHRACLYGSGYVSWPVIEALMNITFDALLYAEAHKIEVDTFYINRTFDFPGKNYPEETQRFMAVMPRHVDPSWAEYLLRPLSSGALELQNFPDEALAQICSPDRLRLIFPLVVKAQALDEQEMKAWVAATGLVTEDLNLTAEVGDIRLHVQVSGNRAPQLPGREWEAPTFGLIVSAGCVVTAMGWEVFSALVRQLQARAAQPVLHGWHSRDKHVSVYVPSAEGTDVILGLSGIHISMTADNYLALETAFLAEVNAPAAAPVLAELRALYGDL